MCLSSVICNMYTTLLQYLLYLPGDYKVDGGREEEKGIKPGGGGRGGMGGRGQAAGRRLVTVKSIIIIISVVFFVYFCRRFPERNATLAFALSPIPTGNPDASAF